ncbi:nucleoside triphosphate pyrophosphohydrolase [Candidatus Poribacteria bacterium]|nr:nucleoside triphosphate pyrophosphohydrolase [Candidatus Poribacteria bacterium]
MREDPKPSVGEAFARLVEIIAILRSENGCPWDRAQTHTSLTKDLVEETYEVIEAIEVGSPGKLAEELGDLLINVALHARIAEEADGLSMVDVLNLTNDKLVRRHEHVFGEGDAGSPEEVIRLWERIKRGEPGSSERVSVLDGVPSGLPALMAAAKLQKKASRVGFDWETVAPTIEKVREEVAELEADIAIGSDSDRLTEELGDVLFAVVNVARLLGVEPESALRSANAKFSRRFQSLEQELQSRGEDFGDHDLESLDRIWDDVKRREREEPSSVSPSD